jgi:hypothetical protein
MQFQAATESDGIRVIKHRTTNGNVSPFFVSTKLQVSPSQMIQSVKVRLQYLIQSH